MSKTRIILLLFTLLINFTPALALVEYTSVCDGSWKEKSAWLDHNAPPTNLTYMDAVMVRHAINTSELAITNGGIIHVQEGGILDASNIDLPGNTGVGGWVFVEKGGTLVLSTVNDEYFDITDPHSRIIVLDGGKLINPSPLPVKLVYFNAKRIAETVELEWATTEEVNNNYIAVERSGDGFEFTPIYTCAGKNTKQLSIYRHTDRQPLKGTAYYRLKQVDNDGTVTYSKILAISACDINLSISEKLRFSKEVSGTVHIRNLSGELVFQAQLTNQQELILPQVQKGIYFILAEVNGKAFMQKVIL